MVAGPFFALRGGDVLSATCLRGKGCFYPMLPGGSQICPEGGMTVGGGRGV